MVELLNFRTNLFFSKILSVPLTYIHHSILMQVMNAELRNICNSVNIGNLENYAESLQNMIWTTWAVLIQDYDEMY